MPTPVTSYAEKLLALLPEQTARQRNEAMAAMAERAAHRLSQQQRDREAAQEARAIKGLQERMGPSTETGNPWARIPVAETGTVEPMPIKICTPENASQKIRIFEKPSGEGGGYVEGTFQEVVDWVMNGKRYPDLRERHRALVEANGRLERGIAEQFVKNQDLADALVRAQREISALRRGKR